MAPIHLDIAELMACAYSTDDKLRLAFIGRAFHLLSQLARNETRKPDGQIVRLQEELTKVINELSDPNLQKRMASIEAGPKHRLFVKPHLGHVLDVTV